LHVPGDKIKSDEESRHKVPGIPAAQRLGRENGSYVEEQERKDTKEDRVGDKADVRIALVEAAAPHHGH
jgi:hypothetical protein